MRWLAIVTLAGGLVVPIANAQDYPTRPLRLIIPFAPGAGSDIVGRLVAEKMANDFSQPVVVENKSGAGGLLANRYVATSARDGYTLLMVTGAYPAQAAMLKEMPFDPEKDISMVSSLIAYPFVLVVKPDSAIRTVSDLVGLANSHAGKLNYATTGPGSVHHLASEMFNMMAGVETVPVAYRGGTTQILELLAGRVDFLFETMPTAMPFIADGRVRVVAVTTKQRWAELPDAPTMADTLPGYEVISFLGVAAPGGTPGPIIAKLNSEIRHVLDHADIRERFKALGGERRPATASETQAFVSGEIRKWKDVVSARGIERQ